MSADPVTMLLISSAASSIMGGLAANQAGKANQSIANANAAAMDRKAKLDRLHGDFKANLQRDRGKRVKGRATAAFMKSSVTIEGTPIEVLGQMAEDIEFDAQSVIYSSMLDENASKNKANMLRYEGQLARQKGRTALTAGIIGAGISGIGAGYASGMLGGAATSTQMSTSSIGMSLA